MLRSIGKQSGESVEQSTFCMKLSLCKLTQTGVDFQRQRLSNLLCKSN